MASMQRIILELTI